MDFVNRLRSDHLTSFWYFPSKVNFALVATFGSLLLATAPCQEEADFYRARLGEYRWTLSVSAKNAGFLSFALESLESSTDLLKALPLKPKIEELDFREMGRPQLPIPFLIPPSDSRRASTAHLHRGAANGASNTNSQDGDEEDEDEMMDAEPVLQPIHSSDFQGQQFLSGWSGWNDAGTGNISPIAEDAEIGPEFFQQNNNSAFARNSAFGSGGGGVRESVYSNNRAAGGFAGGRDSAVLAGGGARASEYGWRDSGAMEVDGWGSNRGGWGDGYGSRPNTQISGGGMFAGTALMGLDARNWFDNSHHGSPEADMGLGI